MPRKAPRTTAAIAAPSGPSARRRSGRNGDDQISMGLRKLWEHVEKEPVPDAFLALLDQIDAARSDDAPPPVPDPRSGDAE